MSSSGGPKAACFLPAYYCCILLSFFFGWLAACEEFSSHQHAASEHATKKMGVCVQIFPEFTIGCPVKSPPICLPPPATRQGDGHNIWRTMNGYALIFILGLHLLLPLYDATKRMCRSHEDWHEIRPRVMQSNQRPRHFFGTVGLRRLRVSSTA